MWVAAWMACGPKEAAVPAATVIIPAYRAHCGISADGTEVEFWFTPLLTVAWDISEYQIDWYLDSRYEELEWNEGPFLASDDTVLPLVTFRSPRALGPEPYRVSGAIHPTGPDGTARSSLPLPECFVWAGEDSRPRVAPAWWILEQLGPNRQPLVLRLPEVLDEIYPAPSKEGVFR